MPHQVGHSLGFSGGGFNTWALAGVQAKVHSLASVLSAEDSAVRCEQLDLLQDWLADFRKSTSSSSTANPEELVVFDIICGDLNFDNCSSGEALLLPLRSEASVRAQAAGSHRLQLGSLKNFWFLMSVWGKFTRTGMSAPH